MASGYCFSASLPAYCTAAALSALRQLEAEPQLLARLRESSAALTLGLTTHFKLADASDDKRHLEVDVAAN